MCSDGAENELDMDTKELKPNYERENLEDSCRLYASVVCGWPYLTCYGPPRIPVLT
jgi:hypothetical protein